LGDDVFAVASLLDHRYHPGELPLGTPQPIQNRGDAVFITNHGELPSFVLLEVNITRGGMLPRAGHVLNPPPPDASGQ
jgi:hypothetical protein